MMSRTDDLRAAKESRADLAQRAARPGLGDTLTHMVDAAVYRATHPTGTGPRPGNPDPPPCAAERNLSELRTPQGTVRYVDTGTGAPVLLVHGIFGGSDAALRQLGPLVPDGFRIIAPSRYGYLWSTLPADVTPAEQADAFAALLDHLGLAKVAVLAVSTGATSALWLAMRHPRRVAALVLISPNRPEPGRGKDRDFVQIDAPTLVVHPTDDALNSYEGVPGARLLTVERGGHLVLGEHPVVRKAVRDLLASTTD